MKQLMNRRRLGLALAVLLIAGGVGWVQGVGRGLRGSIRSVLPSSPGIGSKTPDHSARPGPAPRPPDPDRRFRDLTPEQRVELARKPHGVGG